MIYLKGIDYSQFSEADFGLTFILAASVVGLITRFWQILIWFTILSGLGAVGLRQNLKQLVYVYAKSWMGRYIPGTVPWILGKIFFASKLGISKNKLAVSSLLEGSLQVAVVMAVGFLMLFSDDRLGAIDARIKFFMILVLSLCIFSVFPPVFNRIVSLLYKILKKKTLSIEHLIDGKTVLRGSSMYAIGAILNGISLFLIAKAIYPQIEINDALFIMGVGNIAGAISMLAIFAPSGLGVREGVQLTLLSLIMPTELALLVTITTRLWGVAMDVIFFGIAKLTSSY